MSNEFFNAAGVPGNNAPGLSSVVRNEFSNVGLAFDKFPAMTGNGLKLLRVNSGGTALEAVDKLTLSDAFLPLTGGTLSGALTLNSTLGVTGVSTFSGNAVMNGTSLFFDAAAGNIRRSIFRSGALNRWHMGVDATAEGGSNAGSNFFLQRFDDAGSGIDIPLTINRATGVVTLTGTSIDLTGTGIRQINHYATGGAFEVVTRSAQPIKLYTNSALALTLASAGGAALGTFTPSTWNATGRALEVGNAGSALWGYQNGTTYLMSGLTNDGAWRRTYTNVAGTLYGQEQGGHGFYGTSATGAAGTSPAVDLWASITATGLGVGMVPTTNYRLDVAGTIRSIGGEATPSGYGVRVLNAAQNGGGSLVALTGAGAGMRVNSDGGPLYLNTNGADRFVIDAGGNISVTGPIGVGFQNTVNGVIGSSPTDAYTYDANKTVAHYGLTWKSLSYMTSGPSAVLSAYGHIEIHTQGVRRAFFDSATGDLVSSTVFYGRSGSGAGNYGFGAISVVTTAPLAGTGNDGDFYFVY